MHRHTHKANRVAAAIQLKFDTFDSESCSRFSFLLAYLHPVYRKFIIMPTPLWMWKCTKYQGMRFEFRFTAFHPNDVYLLMNANDPPNLQQYLINIIYLIVANQIPNAWMRSSQWSAASAKTEQKKKHLFKRRIKPNNSDFGQFFFSDMCPGAAAILLSFHNQFSTTIDYVVCVLILRVSQYTS